MRSGNELLKPFDRFQDKFPTRRRGAILRLSSRISLPREEGTVQSLNLLDACRDIAEGPSSSDLGGLDHEVFQGVRKANCKPAKIRRQTYHVRTALTTELVDQNLNGRVGTRPRAEYTVHGAHCRRISLSVIGCGTMKRMAWRDYLRAHRKSALFSHDRQEKSC